jgi:signal transduction histidine kinase/ActR/RegA family two-component response regulator
VRSTDRVFSEDDERLLTHIAGLGAGGGGGARRDAERARADTELSAAQDELLRTEKLRALGEMASGVAHDFNNLLASILGRAQLLLQRITEPQASQWLKVIERAALDGAQTVRQLQEFTRTRRDQSFAAVALNQVVRDALDITQSRWSEESHQRGIRYAVRTDLSEVPTIAGDAVELRETMTNLILNALDAMPSGGTLTIATAVVDGQVEVRVSDTGTGIPEAVRAKIFDPFFTTKGPKGTGLGLSITYGIVSRHNGEIIVESEEGAGTTFRLAFPPGGEAVVAEPAATQEVAPVRGLRCLVVDDEVDVGEVLGDVLEAGGHTVVVLADAAQAVERFRAERFDLVFTDLAMPAISGWEVAESVKQMRPDVPVVMMTGFVELSAKERASKGVDAVLVKPVKIEDILEVVARLAQRAERQHREDRDALRPGDRDP